MTNLYGLIAKMIEYEDGCVERVNHFFEGFCVCESDCRGRGADRETQDILEAAAVTHDVGIRVCFEKYGMCSGPQQELEGPPVAAALLPACGYTPEACARICYLIGRHHTYTDIDGADYRFSWRRTSSSTSSRTAWSRRPRARCATTSSKRKPEKKLLTDLYL